MSRNSRTAEVEVINGKVSMKGRRSVFALCLLAFALLTGCGVRFDMQDQPRYKTYKKSDFFKDGRASRDLPEGTVARGLLKDNKAFYTGKIDNPDPNVQVQTTTDPTGNTLVSSFPNDITEFPITVTKDVIDRGQDRFNIYCIVCHGPVGAGDVNNAAGLPGLGRIRLPGAVVVGGP